VVVFFGLLGILNGFEVRPLDEELTSKATQAVVEVHLTSESGGLNWNFCGTLVSQDGKLIVPLKAMCFKRLPRFKDGAGKELEFQKFLRVDLSSKLALIQLKHQTKHWLTIAERDSAVGENVAFLWRNSGKQGVHHGPVIARRPRFDDGCRSNRLFQSLGMNLGPLTDLEGPFGSPIVDSDGRLTGVHTSTEAHNSFHPVAILAATVTQLRELMSKKDAHPIGVHPLPPELNPWEDVYWDYNVAATLDKFNKHEISNHGRGQDLASERRDEILNSLKSKYPESSWLTRKLCQRELQRMLQKLSSSVDEETGAYTDITPMDLADMMADLDEVLSKMKKLPDPGPDDSALSAATRIELAVIALRGDPDGKLPKIRKEIEALPEGPSAMLIHTLSLAESSCGDPAAKESTKRAAELAPDSIFFLECYQSLLEKTGEYEASDQISKRVFDLERVYSPR